MALCGGMSKLWQFAGTSHSPRAHSLNHRHTCHDVHLFRLPPLTPQPPPSPGGACRLEAKHQSFKRLSPTIYWPKVLIQFAEKHNMRIAYEIMEGMHANCMIGFASGTSVEDFTLEQHQPMHSVIMQLTRSPLPDCRGDAHPHSIFGRMLQLMRVLHCHAGPLECASYGRMLIGGKEYAQNATYVITPNCGLAKVGILHSLILSKTTDEIYLTLNCYDGVICYLEGHMPAISFRLENVMQTMAMHNLLAVEAAVVHRLQSKPDFGLVVKY